ncbi:SDR family NAD(P)-dependent oxidoreductase [Ectothiorhodospiraceae bacterium BW-2]|nr:SDR family NAD(P)-dependent oxidoreductase [Ectothiorhodospiraceae bacterium BW-2]
MVSGGLRGVTADCLVALTQHIPLKLALLGRSAFSEEALETRGLTSDAALQQWLLQQAKAKGESLTPTQLRSQLAAIHANREMARNRHRLEQTGATVRYFRCDISDRAAVEHALTTIRAEWGAIRGIVHGAGVLADKLIQAKSDAQFHQVFNTKVEGFRTLLRLTCDDPLTLICCFSSVAARTGNRGQSDYAMANEVLNKVCQFERDRRLAAAQPCLVKSINWGPWAGGWSRPNLKPTLPPRGWSYWRSMPVSRPLWLSCTRVSRAVSRW